jgi:hypothetical protein
MDYVMLYITVGTAYSITMSFVDQMEMEGQQRNTMDNLDRIISVLLWPLLSTIVVYTIIKSLNDK